MHTFRIVVRIVFLCGFVLQAFYEMYRFGSECSGLSELQILLWAGFQNLQLCQNRSVFRSYKCLCVTLYKIQNLILCITVCVFFPQSLLDWVERYSTGLIRVNSLSLFTTSSAEISCHICTKPACSYILSLFQSHHRKILKKKKRKNPRE